MVLAKHLTVARMLSVREIIVTTQEEGDITSERYDKIGSSNMPIVTIYELSRIMEVAIYMQFYDIPR